YRRGEGIGVAGGPVGGRRRAAGGPERGARVSRLVGVVVLALLIVVPIVEIAVAIQVAHHIGGPDTILLLLGLSLGGVWLAKRAGFGVLARMREQVERGVLPGNELIDGVLVFVAGVLLLIPGFVTGVIGLVLLLPPV